MNPKLSRAREQHPIIGACVVQGDARISTRTPKIQKPCVARVRPLAANYLTDIDIVGIEVDPSRNRDGTREMYPCEIAFLAAATPTRNKTELFRRDHFSVAA